MERAFLEKLGIDKQIADEIMAQYGKDIGAHKNATENAIRDRDTYKEQLESVTDKLKAFDGVDLTALRAEIDSFKAELAQMEIEHKSQLAERDFSAMLSAEIVAAKGRNPKAITALLDIEALKNSKNQKEDTAAAIKAIAESDGYLFEPSSAEPAAASTMTVTTGAGHAESGEAFANGFISAAIKAAGLKE